MKVFERIISLVQECPVVEIPVTPRGKIRTSIGDTTWHYKLKSSDPKKRKRAEVVKAYYDYCDAVRWCAKKARYEIGEEIAVEFRLPMPASWAGKKKARMAGTIHQVKPDTDNMLKGLVDALAKSDSHIHFKLAWKVWDSGPGKILIYDVS